MLMSPMLNYRTKKTLKNSWGKMCTYIILYSNKFYMYYILIIYIIYLNILERFKISPFLGYKMLLILSLNEYFSKPDLLILEKMTEEQKSAESLL